MNFVEPIRGRKRIAQIKNLLRGQERYRDLLLVVVGINAALRIFDLLELKVEHFLDEQGHVQQRFCIEEKKRGKWQEAVVNESIRKALNKYLATYPGIGKKPGNFVFFNPKNNDYSHPIKRGQGWKFITSERAHEKNRRRPGLQGKTFKVGANCALEDLEGLAFSFGRARRGSGSTEF